MSDELWLIIEDTTGTNLLDSFYTGIPSIQGGGFGLDFYPERVVITYGIEEFIAWKINLDMVQTDRIYRLANDRLVGEFSENSYIGTDFEFEVEFDIVPKKNNECQKN